MALSAASPVGIGIVGCGTISGAYLSTLSRLPFLRVVACADVDGERAQATAQAIGARALPLDRLLEAREVDVVLNLTPPAAHAEVGLAALAAGKHVYGEKPFAAERGTGAELLALAQRNGLRVGCAPDTFFGDAWQEARRLIDSGSIGTPVAGRATFLCHGHESWHPAPAFYYQQGGGPLFDMAPYYLTALVSLLGPVRRVAGAARITFPTRTVTSKPRAGELIEVETPTHVSAVVEFEQGAVVTLVTSFDVWMSEHSIELFGSDGTLLLPDPNRFGGQIAIRGATVDGEWQRVDPTGRLSDQHRGVGLAEMALALREGRDHRASGELAFHVLDVISAVLAAADSGKVLEIASACRRPDPLDPELRELLCAGR